MQFLLTQLNGFDSRGPTRGKVSQPFRPVQYSSKSIPVDFFRPIGDLPARVPFKRRHSNPAGERSVCATDYDDQWRDAYWRGFYPAAATKLSDWAH